MKELIVAILITLSLSLITPISAIAGPTSGSVEIFFQPDAEESHPSGDLFLAHHFDKWGLGVSAFAFITEGWAELLAGPTWAPTEWLELGFSVGFEQTGGELGLRFSPSVWVGHGSFSFLGVVEFTPDSFTGDDSGVWFDLTPKFKVFEWLAVGLKFRRPVGVGPLVELSTPTTPSITAWLCWAPIDPEKVDGDLAHLDRVLVGLKLVF